MYNQRKTLKNLKFVYYKNIEICAILYNWKTTYRIESGFSLIGQAVQHVPSIAIFQIHNSSSACFEKCAYNCLLNARKSCSYCLKIYLKTMPSGFGGIWDTNPPTIFGISSIANKQKGPNHPMDIQISSKRRGKVRK